MTRILYAIGLFFALTLLFLFVPEAFVLVMFLYGFATMGLHILESLDKGLEEWKN